MEARLVKELESLCREIARLPGWQIAGVAVYNASSRSIWRAITDDDDGLCWAREGSTDPQEMIYLRKDACTEYMSHVTPDLLKALESGPMLEDVATCGALILTIAPLGGFAFSDCVRHMSFGYYLGNNWNECMGETREIAVAKAILATLHERQERYAKEEKEAAQRPKPVEKKTPCGRVLVPVPVVAKVPPPNVLVTEIEEITTIYADMETGVVRVAHETSKSVLEYEDKDHRPVPARVPR